MITQVGLVVVHGIGEQRRFDHLDQQLRGFIEQLRCDYSGNVTVEIIGASTAANQATQDTWRAGPYSSLRIILNQGANQTHFHVHEVWWADVNEPYSVMKQIRFWLWGLSIWWFPTKLTSTHPLAQDRMRPVEPTAKDQTYARWQIYWLGSFFLSLSLFFGTLFNLLKRLLNVDAPNILATFVNYLSSIKLYNQPVRHGLGLSQPPADFLDALDEPPRVSIRRRMVRTLADVACAGYDRWYVLAHSLGSVVAFNGLMEPAYAVPSYLDEARWERLKAMTPPMAGPADLATYTPPPANASISPERPAWLGANHVVYRAEMFGKFGGLLTYGCPLGKFSAIWPALVPFCREPAFPSSAVWINVFDPLDPVSGVLNAMRIEYKDSNTGALSLQSLDSLGRPEPVQACPLRINLGYCSNNWLLQAHVTYLDRDLKNVSLVELVANWLIGGNPTALMTSPQKNPREAAAGQGDKRYGRFYSEQSSQHHARNWGMLVSWLSANFALLTINVGVVTIWQYHGFPKFALVSLNSISRLSRMPTLMIWILLFLLGPFAVTWLVGVVRHWGEMRRIPVSVANKSKKSWPKKVAPVVLVPLPVVGPRRPPPPPKI